MPNEFARNRQDASLNPAAFALSNGAGTTQSAGINLGTDTVKPENMELELYVPALSSTHVPDTRTVTYIIESSTTSNFAAVAQTLASVIVTGASSAGSAARNLRCRVPSDCAQYVRGKVTLGASTGDASLVSGTFRAKF